MYELRATASPRTDAEENKDEVTVSKFKRRLSQVIACQSCNLLLLVSSISMGFPTLIIGCLLHSEGELTLDDEQASWLASIIYFGQPLGGIVSGALVGTLGRKKLMLLLNVPFLAGFILLSVADSYAILILANVILGIASGFAGPLVSVHIGELTEPEIRGMLSASSGIFFYLGWLIDNLIGAFWTWQKTVAVTTVAPVIAALSLTLIPESPEWLISKNRLEDAERALCWLRGWVKPGAVDQELQDLVRYHSEMLEQPPSSVKGHINLSFVEDIYQTSDVNNCTNTTDEESAETQSILWYQKVLAVVRDLKSPSTRRPLLLVLFFMFFANFAGMMSVTPFMDHIFTEFGMPIKQDWAVVITTGMSTFGTAAVALLVHRFGKRLISLVCTGILVVVCILLGVYAYLEVNHNKGEESAAYSWMPLVLFSTLYFANSAVGDVPWILLSEVFPFRTSGMAGGISAACANISRFLASKTYLDIEKIFHPHGTYWFYGCISVVGFVVLYFRLPETEGRTLEEIQMHFTKSEYPRNVKKFT